MMPMRPLPGLRNFSCVAICSIVTSSGSRTEIYRCELVKVGRVKLVHWSLRHVQKLIEVSISKRYQLVWLKEREV